MANRHAHKKLRAEIRLRMAKTGESYQAARARILTTGRTGTDGEVDLVPFRFFGVPMTLATAGGRVVHSISVLGATRASGPPYPLPLALWLRPQGVN